MTLSTNNISKLDRFNKEVVNHLNLVGLSKIFPFVMKPKINSKGNNIYIVYNDIQTMSKVDKVLGNLDLHNAYMRNKSEWAIITEEGLAIWYNRTGGDKPLLSFSVMGNLFIPFYVDAFFRIIKCHYKKSTIHITDKLPYFFSVMIKTKFNLKQESENILRQVANFETYDKNNKSKVEDIIRNEKPLRRAMDMIFQIIDTDQEMNYSYCLGDCGSILPKGKFFCRTSGINPNNCLNKINYWLKVRLGITDTEERARKREELMYQFQEIIKAYPLYALDEFKNRNPELYKPKYNDRWERERKNKIQ